MLCLAITNLVKEFDLHSRFGSVVLAVVVVERLAVSLSERWDYTPFKFLFNDIHCLMHELVLNCVHRQIGGRNGGFNLTLQLLVWDLLQYFVSMAKQIKRLWT